MRAQPFRIGVLCMVLAACSDRRAVPTNPDTSVLLSNVSDPMRGSALFFDGADDYVEIPDASSLDLIDGFTVAAWIYLVEYTEWASVVTKGGLPDDAGNGNNYTIHQSGPAFPVLESELGHLRFTADGPALPIPLPESNSVIPLEEWHFIAVTFDGTTVRFYLDGELDGEQTVPGALIPNDEPLHLGVDFPGGDEYWHGLIDEVRIWNQPLQLSHIRAAMRGHSSPLASALVGYWQFDEGSGNIVRDRSGYRNDGALVGNPLWVSPGAPNQP